MNADPLVVFSTDQKKVLFNELAGKTVVVVEGFTADQLMSAKKGINLIRLNTQNS